MERFFFVYTQKGKDYAILRRLKTINERVIIMNYGTLAGNLGADPEVRFTSSGQKVTTLRVAARARKDETIWWRVTIWGEQFDKLISYLKKGSSVVVMGEILKPEVFTGKDGKPQVSMQIVAFNISFSPFGKGKSGEEGAQTAANNYGAQNAQGSAGGMNHEAPAFESSFGSGGGHDEEIPF